MYRDFAYSHIRFTVGTELVGLTYCLSREKLEQLNPRVNKSGNLGNDGPTLSKTTIPPKYCLERSYLTWLDQGQEFISVSRQDERWEHRPLRPLVNRIHDWTLRLGPGIDGGLSFFDMWYDLYDLLRSSLFHSPHISAMSAAALGYGGLHLLAWNAPFHAPVYGLLWKISGIMTASLAVIPLVNTGIYLLEAAV
jgi:hypothetical protein